MPKWTCPNGHDDEKAVVCGGSTPWANHGFSDEDEDHGNVYFLMDLSTEEYTREAESDVPFILTDEDWADMHDHADGGCCSEPQCLTCLEYLNRSEDFKVVTVSDDRNSFGLRGVVLVAKDGKAFEVASNDLNLPEVGAVLNVQHDLGRYLWEKHGFEIPRELDPPAPPEVIREVWGWHPTSLAPPDSDPHHPRR